MVHIIVIYNTDFQGYVSVYEIQEAFKQEQFICYPVICIILLTFSSDTYMLYVHSVADKLK